MRLAARAAGLTFSRYVVASVASLGLDMALFLTLLHLKLPAMAAASIAYSIGIVAHWLLSTRFVFDDGMVASGPERARQKTLFVGSAIIGLGLTTLVVGLGARLGGDPRLVKMVAVAISFQATYLARRSAIFRS